MPRALGRRTDRRADIGGGVARRETLMCRQEFYRDARQLVAELLELFGEHGIIATEATMILDDPQCFRRSIRGGVEDASGVHVLDRIAELKRLIKLHEASRRSARCTVEGRNTGNKVAEAQAQSLKGFSQS